MTDAARLITLEREEISPASKELFLKDFAHLASEYFESETPAAIDFTRTEEGFSVCIIFQARRVKNVKAVK